MPIPSLVRPPSSLPPPFSPPRSRSAEQGKSAFGRQSVQDRLQQRLGTKVNISHTKKGGRIIIHYYSDEELHALLEQIAGE